MMGIPNKLDAESNNNTMGKLNPMTKIIDRITNFCWCLFFIFAELISVYFDALIY